MLIDQRSADGRQSNCSRVASDNRFRSTPGVCSSIRMHRSEFGTPKSWHNKLQGTIALSVKYSVHFNSLYCAVILAPAAMLLALTGCSKQQAQAVGGMPTVPVSVAVAAAESHAGPDPRHRHRGTILDRADQIAGRRRVAQRAFHRRPRREQGRSAVRNRSAPYREALAQAEAAVAKDRAQLAQAQANLARDTAQAKSAEADGYRYEQLAKEGVASQMQATQSRATADAAHESVRADQAAIESARASLESDQAAVARAKLDLGYCEIRSPVSGRTGNLLVHPGNLVKVNDVPLVVINQISPIFVSFGVPEQHLAAIRQQRADEA